MSERKLVVLDVNGLLCWKDFNKETNECPEIIYKNEYVKCDKMILYIRPLAREFINRILEVADVALWTSGNYYNFNKLVSKLDIKFKFVWYRTMTELVKPGSHETVKRVKRIIKCPDTNYHGNYNEDNIIIIDNDIEKVKMNKHYIIVEEYDINVDDSGKLDKIFELISQEL